MTEEFTQLVDYEGFELKLEAEYTPATKGQKGDFGVPMEPDTAAEYELTGVLIQHWGAKGESSLYEMLSDDTIEVLTAKLIYPEL
jgi:hypothetical protein